LLFFIAIDVATVNTFDAFYEIATLQNALGIGLPGGPFSVQGRREREEPYRFMVSPQTMLEGSFP
jgi:hypothetical protein